jgi:bacterioferritin
VKHAVPQAGDHVVRHAASDVDAVVAALNQALGNQVACYLRHKRQFFAARDSGAGHAARALLDHAQLQLDQAQRLAARIVNLGGAPDFAPDELAAADRIAMRITGS